MANITMPNEETEIMVKAAPGEIVLRAPTVADVPGMVDIINHYAQQGIMLARSRHAAYQHLREFLVALEGDKVVGVGALSVVWDDLCEVRSLAIRPTHVGMGLGRRIVLALMEQARALGLPRVFCLTYQDGFFANLGFQEIDKESLPHKIWGDCLNCPKYPDCDEIAMMREL